MKGIIDTEEFGDYVVSNKTADALGEDSAMRNQDLLSTYVAITEEADGFDFDELEAKLRGQLEEELAGLEFLKEEKDKIGNPDAIGETIKNVVWEQFINQIATTAGEDFIKENHGLNLDLRKEAHIQTTENFAEGKIATHNTEINYQERYDTWQSNFQRNEDGSIKTKVDNRTGEEKAVLRVQDKKKDPNGENYNTNYNAREFIDKDRPQGSKTVHKDHTVSAAEIIRDAEANAHMTRDEQAAFANSEKNLVDLDSRANESKGDSKMTDWLDSERNGEKPADRFPINEEELRKRDQEAREEYEKLKKEAEQRSVEAGKKSRKEEAKRIGGKAVRAVIMQLLAELVKEIIAKLVKWFKSAKKKLETLLAALKEAISSFVSKLKTHLINAADTTLTTIATAIFGPVINTIKKVWTMLKQGWQSLKEAIAYIRNPENKGKSVGILMLEVGKIVMAGLSAAGAIVLGEVIEKALIAIPGAGAFFAFEIPLLGSLANILGIFLGAVVAGIVGAIAINLLQKKINEAKKAGIVVEQIDRGNEALRLQQQVRTINEAKLEHTVAVTETIIQNRHTEAAQIIKDSVARVAENCKKDNEFEETQSNIDDWFTKLKEE